MAFAEAANEELDRNLRKLEDFYSEMGLPISAFEKFWAHASKNMGKIYASEDVQRLHDESHEIIEELDERLPSVNGFVKDVEEEEETEEGEEDEGRRGDKARDLLTLAVLKKRFGGGGFTS